MKSVILSRDLGIFLGIYNGSHVLFSKFGSIGSWKALAFNSHDEAEEFIEEYIGDADKELEIVSIPANPKLPYVTAIDLVRGGYGDYIFNMMDYMPHASKTQH